MTRLIKIKNVDIEKIGFQVDLDAKSIWLNYDGDRVLFQFPKLSCPFKDPVSDYKGNKSYSLTLECKDKKVLEVLDAIQKKYLEFMTENLSKFGKKKIGNMSYEELLDHSINSVNIIKEWKDISLVKVKLPLEKDTDNFNIDIIRKDNGSKSEIKLTCSEEDLVLFRDCDYTIVSRFYGNFINSLTFTMRNVRMMMDVKKTANSFLNDSDEDDDDDNDEDNYTPSENSEESI